MSRGWKTAGFIFTLWAASGTASHAQTFTNLVTFDITNGAYPSSALVQGLDGSFYGTTEAGNGRNQCYDGCGEVFKVTPAGALTIVHGFDKTDGGYPVGGLVLATNGNFYGSTNGSSLGDYSVPSFFFEITPEGALTNFPTPNPTSTAMIQYSVNGNLYGTTVNGTVGEIFGMTPSGTISTVYNFDNPNNLVGRPLAPLVEGTDEFFYGTTESGGDKVSSLCPNLPGQGCGMFFRVGTGGHLGVRHIFDGTDGATPLGGLIQGDDGNFYGTTEYGGGASDGGTVFKMTPTGDLTTLHSFGCSIPSCPEGAYPLSGVVQATDGNFYGTTAFGGNGEPTGCQNGCGTIFKITPAGALTTLHSFDKTDGVYPAGGLLQGTDGNLYGTTGGTNGLHLYGTVFKLSLGLPPFVKTVPTAAYAGTTIFILGTNLTSATAVSFNGKAAAFTVVSATEITATVPKGSTTGTVEVTIPSGTLSSNIPFRVF
jgi:uncharacterized repeat protein (TIGR03803 family)